MPDKIVLHSYVGEFARYRTLAEHAFAQVDDRHFAEVVGDSSIAMYATHVGGNLVSRFTDFLTSDGEKEWRDRDSEFDFTRISKQRSQEVWTQGWGRLEATLLSLDDTDLHRLVVIRQMELTVSAALARSLAHTAYHVGQIVLLAKIQAGAAWKSTSVPRPATTIPNHQRH